MPDPYVYADVPVDPPDRVDLTPDDQHHLENVLRLDAGARLVLSDGHGRTWEAVLTDDAGARLDGPSEHRARRSPRIHVLQALPKGRKMDEIVRSLVELGVDTVTPVPAARSVRELSAAKSAREESRWQSVARSAAAQARRRWLPEVREVTPVAEAAVLLRHSNGAGFVPHPEASTPLRAALEAATGPDDPGTGALAIAIGPEGGWTRDEVATWHSAGLVPVSLGPTILRTEHAAFAVASVVSYALGRLG